VHQQGRRILWMALCLGAAAAVYFGTLLASGLRLRQFMHRG
jgi:putative peptidoglycan lipid II flippase